jgi:hypothetical protein
MAKLESLTCALDLRDPSNSLSIAGAKPSQEIRVLVRPEDDATAKLMEAVGTLSNDGKSFSVVVTREDGAQKTFDLCYRDFLKALSDIDETERSTDLRLRHPGCQTQGPKGDRPYAA